MSHTQVDAVTTSHAAMRPVSSIVATASGISRVGPMRLGAATTSSNAATRPSQIDAATARGRSAA
eukprot:4612874-Prymnesium_polylepis.1